MKGNCKLRKYHNKLVRDKIPQIIRESGKDSLCRCLSEEEMTVYLEKKLTEEVEEYYYSKSLEELADILEVVYALAEMQGCDKLRLEEVRLQKEIENGAFKNGIFLEYVDDFS